MTEQEDLLHNYNATAHATALMQTSDMYMSYRSLISCDLENLAHLM
jgi:hypothetical protein